MTISFTPSGASSSRPGDGPSGASGVLATTLLLLGAIAAANPSSARAQQAETVDTGRFEIREGDSAVATESFAIRREASAVQSVARRSPVPGRARGLPTVEFRMQTNSRYEPAFFEYRLRNAEVKTVVGVRSGNRLKLTTRTAEGERWQEFRLSPGLVLLPEGLAHTYYFILQTLGQATGGELSVLHPLEGKRSSLTIVDRGTERVQAGGESREASRVSLRVDQETHTVWVDDRGGILRVEIPGRNWLAVRLPEEGESPDEP